jgi:hypothetical protein
MLNISPPKWDVKALRMNVVCGWKKDVFILASQLISINFNLLVNSIHVIIDKCIISSKLLIFIYMVNFIYEHNLVNSKFLHMTKPHWVIDLIH